MTIVRKPMPIPFTGRFGEVKDAVLAILVKNGPSSWDEIQAALAERYPDITRGEVLRATSILQRHHLAAGYYTGNLKPNYYVRIFFTPEWDPGDALRHWYKTRGVTPLNPLDELARKYGVLK